MSKKVMPLADIVDGFQAVAIGLPGSRRYAITLRAVYEFAKREHERACREFSDEMTAKYGKVVSRRRRP